MYNNPMPFSGSWNKAKDLEMKNGEVYSNYSASIKRRLEQRLQIHQLAEKLKISEEEKNKMWYEQTTKVAKNKAELKKKPVKEGRDNKDVLVGSGGSNHSSVRYPSKKRSLSTWKKFYKLFPRLAVADKFDGKISTKMK